MERCDHDIATVVVKGNTRFFCPKCSRYLEGSKDEFPGKSPEWIMHSVYDALPESSESGTVN